MSHVTDGELHAVLDGQLDRYPGEQARRVRDHLESCPRCASRLESEARVREAAMAVLDAAGPRDVSMPSFESLRRRASRETARGWSRTVKRLSWAASIALALGTGWMLRGGDGAPLPEAGPGALQRVRSPLTAATGAREEAKPASPVEPGAVAANSAAPGESDASMKAAGGEARTADAGRAPARDVQVEQAAPTQAATRLAEAVGAGASGVSTPSEDSTRAAATRPGVRLAGADVARPAAAPEPVESFPPGGALSLDARVVTREPRPEAGAGDERLRRIEREAVRPVDAFRLERARARMPAPTLPRAPVALEGGSASTDRGKGARERSGRDAAPAEEGSLVVPGLTVISVSALETDGAAGGVRVLQLLATGDTLEIVHIPLAVDPAGVLGSGDGRAQVVRRRGASWIVARAPVPTDELEALIRRLLESS